MKKKIILTLSIILCLIVAGTIAVINISPKQAPNYAIDKIYGIATVWKAAHELYGLWDIVPELDWDESFKEYTEIILKTETQWAYYKELSSFLALLSDGHSGISMPELEYSNIHVSIMKYEDKFFITDTDKQTQHIPILSEVTAINGIDTETYLRTNYLDRSGIKTKGADLIQALILLMIGEKDETLELTIKDPNGIIKNEIVTYDNKPFAYSASNVNKIIINNLPIVNTHIGKTFSSFELDNGIFIIMINSFEDERLRDEFDIYMTAVNESGRATGFIIDVRNNGGGSSVNGTSVLKWFIGKNHNQYVNAYIPNVSIDMAAKASKLIMNNQINISGLTQSDIDSILMLGNRYYSNQVYNLPLESLDAESSKKNIIVLSGYLTCSAAEHFVDSAKSAGLLVLGTNTAGMTGTIAGRSFNESNILLSTEQTRYGDNYLITNNGVQPNIWCEPKIEDLFNYQSTVIQEAISLINMANSDPAAYEHYIAENNYEYNIEPLVKPNNMVELVTEQYG